MLRPLPPPPPPSLMAWQLVEELFLRLPLPGIAVWGDGGPGLVFPVVVNTRTRCGHHTPQLS